MKIAAATARPVSLRFARPVRTALGEFRTREIVLFELCDAQGLCGCGEAAPWPGFGSESPADSLASLQDIAARLVGADIDPEEHGDSWASLRERPSVRAAVDGAIQDLAARRDGLALRDRLAAGIEAIAAGPPLSKVPVSALLFAESPEATVAEAVRIRDAGFRAAKLKLGTGRLATDLARLQAAREILGPDFVLRGDANGAWSADEALVALAACAAFGLEYVEQPVSAGDLRGFRHLRGRTPVRIAADESVTSGAVALRLIDEALVDVVVLKPALLGGSSRALEIAARARGAGIGVVFTHAFESAVGARQALHCAAAWGDDARAHGLVTAGLFEQDVAAPVTADAGYAATEEQPGLGIAP
jgi:O-succinylbenzoate synthase